MDRCDVSILIPVHNRVDLTRGCLQSLWPTAPPALRCEVLVYNDHSTDQTAAYLAGLGDRVAVLSRPERGYFSHNMNVLAEAARGRWLCFLNNDIVLQSDWLAALLRLADQQPRAAIIGNFHRFPQSGRINHAGIVFDRDLTPRQLYMGMPDTLACTRTTRQFQGISAACWLIRHDRFHELGGFDPAYRNGYEDLDLCMKARQAGYEVWYCGESRIDHYGQSTPGRMAQDEVNFQLFLQRWRHRIVPDLVQYVNADGQCWPPRSLTYRLLHRCWRSRPVQWVGRPLFNSRLGVRLRQQVISRLTT
jgi:GT2 family glycosyltransferase